MLFFFFFYIRAICNICFSNMVSTHFSYAYPSISAYHKSVNEANYMTIPLEYMHSGNEV